LDDTILKFAKDGLRTLSLSYKEYPKNDISKWEQEPSDDTLIFLGLVGIKDPVRPAVPEAVKECQRAGIIVRMVTGDNIVTAR
jgi:magnesium-transporting ATPase (P-type)